MNTPDQPLNPELLDELLSADLDGEFDRAATELGFEPQTARQWIARTRVTCATLLAARDLLSANRRSIRTWRVGARQRLALSADAVAKQAPNAPTALGAICAIAERVSRGRRQVPPQR